MSDHWETAPRHMMRLDIRSLLQDAAIEEVRFAVIECSESVCLYLYCKCKLQKDLVITC